MKIKLNERMESELIVIIDQLNFWKEKSKTYNKHQSARFERVISNLIYEFRKEGFFCGLKSKGLIIPKGKKPTHDHVYSRKLISDRILEEHLKESLTIDKLREILPVLLTSIILSPKDNQKLSGIVKKNGYTLEDVKKMKHYKKANISLEYKNGNGYYEELVTEEMKELIGLDNTNPFWG
jgi:hypothetical protein